MTSRTLLIRCDASVPIGTGHVMRCIAMAQAWQDAGGQVIFVMAETTSAIEERIPAEKMTLLPLDRVPGSAEDAEQTIRLAGQTSADWVVVDGYVFGAHYQASLHDAGLRLLVVDDHGRANRYLAHIVLNQNPQAREDQYIHQKPSTQLLLGLEYALLRREFANWRQWKRDTPAIARNLLVVMGGTDPENVSQQSALGGSARISAEVRRERPSCGEYRQYGRTDGLGRYSRVGCRNNCLGDVLHGTSGAIGRSRGQPGTDCACIGCCRCGPEDRPSSDPPH
jgi:hypothetical protein